MLAQKVGTEVLHAAEMGLSKLSPIVSNLSEILSAADAKVHICRVNKIDLAATKLFDSVFDSGENLAVPWHSYNIRPLRLLLLMKFSFLLDEELLQRFWNYFLMKNEKAVSSGLAKILSEIKERINVLPDRRSRDLIEEAIDWALANPEAIYAHSAGKIARYSNYPNIVAFPELLKAIDNWSKVWEDPITTIKHHEQDQFKGALEFWHEILSNASPNPVTLIGEPELVVRRAFGSDFEISQDSESTGLQVIDTIVWLVKKSQDGVRLARDFEQFGEYLGSNTTWYIT